MVTDRTQKTPQNGSHVCTQCTEYTRWRPCVISVQNREYKIAAVPLLPCYLCVAPEAGVVEGRIPVLVHKVHIRFVPQQLHKVSNLSIVTRQLRTVHDLSVFDGFKAALNRSSCAE